MIHRLVAKANFSKFPRPLDLFPLFVRSVYKFWFPFNTMKWLKLKPLSFISTIEEWGLVLMIWVFCIRILTQRSTVAFLDVNYMAVSFTSDRTFSFSALCCFPITCSHFDFCVVDVFLGTSSFNKHIVKRSSNSSLNYKQLRIRQMWSIFISILCFFLVRVASLLC